MLKRLLALVVLRSLLGCEFEASWTESQPAPFSMAESDLLTPGRVLAGLRFGLFLTCLCDSVSKAPEGQL